MQQPVGSRPTTSAELIPIAFVLLSSPHLPADERVSQAATVAGFGLRLTQADESGQCYAIEIEGDRIAELIVALIGAPFPDLAHYGPSFTSPDPEQLRASPAHYILTVTGLPPLSVVDFDSFMTRLTAAVIAGAPAVGALHSYNRTIHHPEQFLRTLTQDPDHYPTTLCVSLSGRGEPDGRVSLYTHGLLRHGREEFFMTCSPDRLDAPDLLYGLVQWMIQDPDKHLPTGDTVGRNEDERFLVQRVIGPIPEHGIVIHLDLDADPTGAPLSPDRGAEPNRPRPKRRWFRR